MHIKVRYYTFTRFLCLKTQNCFQSRICLLCIHKRNTLEPRTGRKYVCVLFFPDLLAAKGFTTDPSTTLRRIFLLFSG